MNDTQIITDEFEPILSDEISSEIGNDRTLQLDRKKVLVVEDSQDSMDLICHLLRQAGATVQSASNGEEGLEKALEQLPDLLLLDLELPLIDGFSVIKKLRAKNYKRPILAITSHNTIQDRDRCHEAGFDGYISKPFDSERLVRVLREHLSSV